MIKIGLGEDSHTFETEKTKKKLILGGVIFQGEIALKGNSDADVILHAITNAISGITTKPILGLKADTLVKQGKTESYNFLKIALNDLKKIHYKIIHLSISIECSVPKMMPYRQEICENIANLCQINLSDVGLTATTGEGLTEFGKGKGICCRCLATAQFFK